MKLPDCLPSDDALTLELIREINCAHSRELCDPDPLNPFHPVWVSGMNTAIQLQREKARRWESWVVAKRERDTAHRKSFEMHIY